MKKLNQMDLAIIDILTTKPYTINQLNKFYRQDCSPNILKLIEENKIEFKKGKYHIK